MTPKELINHLEMSIHLSPHELQIIEEISEAMDVSAIDVSTWMQSWLEQLGSFDAASEAISRAISRASPLDVNNSQ